MVSFLLFMAALGLVVQAIIGLSFLISSIWEKEPRASVFALLQFLGMSFVLLVFLLLIRFDFFETKIGVALLVLGYVFAIIMAILMLWKARPNLKALKGTAGLIIGDVKRFDERDHVFARNRSLRPGTEQYKAFYEKKPDLEEFDKDRREKGGPLGHPGVIDRPHGESNVAMTIAAMNIPMFLSDPNKVRPEPHFFLKPQLEKNGPVKMSPEEATLRVKGYTKSIGADLVGITEINKLWVYSRRGEIFRENWEDWGKEIINDHPYAIVFAEEMSFEMIGAAPHTPTAVESGKDYAKGAYISTLLASYISNLGYSATANHLRHYEAILPPLAVDAGLGEIGRLGYLMTKEFGPRIRLGAVTTDLPLVPDKPVDIGAEDFCKFCKKCANCCPSQSILLDDEPQPFNGSLRWKLNDNTCFEYWGKIGTDCNICMKVCPWSHARTFPHKLIVEMISRNSLARRIFSVMDDIFYGKKPKPKEAPGWARFKEKED